MAKQDEQFLAHYGILGMKWGVRRADKRSGSSSASTKTSVPRPKKPSEMSLEDLKKANERLKAEKEYRDYLSALNPKKKSQVKEFMFKALSTAALGYLESAAKAYGTKVGGRKDPVDQPKQEKGKQVVAEVLKKAGGKEVKGSDDGKKLIEDLFKSAADDDWSELWLI